MFRSHMQASAGQVHHPHTVPRWLVHFLGAAGRLPTTGGRHHAVQAPKLRGEGPQAHEKPQLQGRVRGGRAAVRGEEPDRQNPVHVQNLLLQC